MHSPRTVETKKVLTVSTKGPIVIVGPNFHRLTILEQALMSHFVLKGHISVIGEDI